MTTATNSSRTNRLLRRLSANESQAAEELFALHHERLRKMIHFRFDRRLRERIRSAEILKEVYREASRRIDTYLPDPQQPFFLWLRQLTGERMFALHRKYFGELTDEGELSFYRGASPEVNSGSLAAQLLGRRGKNNSTRRAEMLRQLQDALNSMNKLQREVLTMYHFEELRDEEVAMILGIDEATASLHYVRSIKQLKQILNSIPGFFDDSTN